MEEAISERALRQAAQKIHPIVELFVVDLTGENQRNFIDLSISDRKLLKADLSSAKGIYAFYNSELEIIYLGKTKGSLWIEMLSAYNREMKHYRRYKVAHPGMSYRPVSGQTVRPIRNSAFYVWEAAAYFSAYSVNDDDLVDLLELMMIRLLPNDLVNRRMEGNVTLRPFRTKEGTV